VVECAILGLPAGQGDPLFDGVENKLAQVLFAIPALKALEFGAGCALAKLRGSQANDSFRYREGAVVTVTNNNGGILGGITTGMPVIFRATFKPTPSIARAQESVDLVTGTSAELTITGRHDPCVVLRALPCVEAAAAVVALDLLLDTAGSAGISSGSAHKID
jgi:chorismate synthase